MTHITIARPEGKLLRAFNLPESDSDHPGDVEIRLLSADYFGNHIRHVERKAHFSEKEIGDALEALVYRKTISATEGGSEE